MSVRNVVIDVVMVFSLWISSHRLGLRVYQLCGLIYLKFDLPSFKSAKLSELVKLEFEFLLEAFYEKK